MFKLAVLLIFRESFSGNSFLRCVTEKRRKKKREKEKKNTELMKGIMK